ncbi:MAG: hypothetical protein KKG76_13200 [Euryarchaeota archaeon]|nr:hypothetical protein [Euryarchaeota archaeon]MBU4138570.1 hypothetical protein [Euryarchaeota archaeon]
MRLPAGRPALILISIIVILAALITSVLWILFFSDMSPDPQLSRSVQDEYSVPVNLKIVNISGKNAAYIIPDRVRWGSGHKKLLYNLSNPKEVTLAFVEILANNDAEALEFIMSQSTRDYWASKGYSNVQALDTYQSMYMNMKEPYIFNLSPGEDDPSEGMVSVSLIRDSGDLHFELNAGLDGTWKI